MKFLVSVIYDVSRRREPSEPVNSSKDNKSGQR